MAVVDEYGSTAGIITLADLLRAWSGRSREGRAGASTSDLPRSEPDGSVLVDGLMRLHEFEEMIGEPIEDPPRGGHDARRTDHDEVDRLPYVFDEIQLRQAARIEPGRGGARALAAPLPAHAYPTCPHAPWRRLTRRVRAGSRIARPDQARTSRIMLAGVWATRRTRVKPASLSTSRSRFSPAWAPSARPTSWLSEAGVQRSVDAE